MMMSIALRFIPTLIEETDKIMSAQKARGADFESGQPHPAGQGPDAHSGAAVHQRLPPGGRAGDGHGVPLLPRRRGADEALHVLRYQAADFVVLAAFVALAAGLIVLKHMGI